MVEIRKIGRKFRGILIPCSNCGKRGLEVYKVYVPNPKTNELKREYYCKKCYMKVFWRREIRE
jgi:hypothetical protein